MGLYSKLITFLYGQYKSQPDRDKLAILTAQSLIQNQKDRFGEIKKDLCKAEFRVFSQWGDDGILQFLVKYLDIQPRTFVEFGVQRYRESNTRFLLMNDNWSGLIMDGSKEDIRFIREDWYYWMHDLRAEKAFITRENINQLLKTHGVSGPLGILSIDIDGNDYWIWEAVEVVDPILVIMEYNSVFGSDRTISTPYAPAFSRTKAHHSNLYFGASLAALCRLAEQKGYVLVGSNSHGNNAFFIKKGFQKDLPALSAKDAYKESKFRESRNKKGGMTYLRSDARIKSLAGLHVVNVETDQEEQL